MREQFLSLRTWTFAILATGTAVILSIVCQALWGPYPMIFFVGAVLVCAWRDRLAGSMIATGLGVAMLLVIKARQMSDLPEAEAQDFGLRLGAFACLGLIAGYLSRRCHQAIDAFDGLQNSLAGLGQGVVLTDEQGEVVYGNVEMAQLAGVDHKDLNDQPLKELLQVRRQTDDAPLELDVPKLIEERTALPFPDDAVLRTRRGDELPVQGGCAPILDDGGQPLGGIVTLRDDSRRRAMINDLLQRDRWARGLLKSAPVPLLLLDAQARALQVSDAAGALTNVRAEHWLQDGWLAQVHPDDRERIIREIETAIASRQPLRADFRIENEEGDFTWMRLALQPFNAPDRADLAAIAALISLAEEKRVEQQLDEARSLLHALAQASPDAVFLKDGEGRCLLTNAAGANWPLAALGDELAKAEAAARAAGQPRDVAFNSAPAWGRVVPYHDADGQVAGVVTFLRDVAAERRVQDDCQTWQRRAEDLGRELQDLKNRHEQVRQKLERDWQRKLQNLATARDEVEAGLRKSLAEADRQTQTLRDAHEALSQELTVLRRQLETRTAAHEDLQSALDDAHADNQLLEEELQRLQTQAASAIDPATLGQLHARLAEAEQRLARQSEEHAAALEARQRAAEEQARIAQDEMQRWWAEQEQSHHETVRRMELAMQQIRRQLGEAGRQAQLASAIVRGLPEGILAVDAEDRYVAWNDQMAAWTGKRAEDVLGRSTGELFEELGDLGEDRQTRDLFRNESLVHKRGLLVLTDAGQSRRLDATYYPLRGEEGEYLGAVAIVREASRDEPIIEATPLSDDFGEHLIESPKTQQRAEEAHAPRPPHRTTVVHQDAGDWLAFN